MRALRLGMFRSISSFIAVLGSAALLSVNACTTEEELGREIPTDGGVTDDASGPSLPDADVDVVDVDGSDPDVDAAPRTCSSQGFCHVPLPEPVTLRGVWGDGTGVVWAVAQEGKILRWDGSTWTVHASVEGALFTIWGSGPTDLWIGGELGIFHGVGPTSTQIAFTAVPSDSDIAITSIHGFGPNDVWAVGGRQWWDPETWEGHEESRVLHYTGPTGDPATEWRRDPMSDRVAVFSSVWGSGPDDVWLGGRTDLDEPYGGVVLHGKRNGDETTFTPVEIGTGFFDRIGRPTGGAALPDEVFVVGEDRNGLGYVWIGPRDPDAGGGTGPKITNGDDFGTGYPITSVWGTSKNDAWIAGKGGRVWHWDGKDWAVGGVSLTKFPLMNDLHAMWGSPNGEMWIVGDQIAMRKNLAVGGDK